MFGPPDLGLDDRLLINDDAGFFVEETELRMPSSVPTPSGVTLQAVVMDPSQPHGIAITNALRAQFAS